MPSPNRVDIPRRWVFLLLLGITVHTFIMNGFYHVHQGQNVGTYYLSCIAHVDPSYFKNSIFAQALERDNLRISVFFDAIPLFLTPENFELFALVQGFVSMFFCVAGIFTLAHVLFGRIRGSCLAALLYTVKLNDWTLGSPSPYLNFFHHSLAYSYPLMIWSLVFFFRKRYPLAMLLAGISWNFHPMCTLFFLGAYGLYFLLRYKSFSPATVVWCTVAFLLSACPGIVKTLAQVASDQGSHELWRKGVYWNTWYTCFPRTWPLSWYVRAGSFLALFLVCFRQLPQTAHKRDMRILLGAVALMCLVGTVFADIVPIPIVIKISFWRSTFLYLIIALPCIAYALDMLLHKSVSQAWCALLVAVFLTGYAPFLPDSWFPVLVFAFAWALHERTVAENFPVLSGRFPAALAMCLTAALGTYWFMSGAAPLKPALLCLGLLVLCAGSAVLQTRFSSRSRWALALLFVIVFDVVMLTHGGGIPIYYRGMYKGALDPWADLQMQARRLSHRDDLFIVPPYCNDFCNYSNRATLSDWAEGANIMYLDNRFAEEWFERMNDLGWTKRFNAPEGFGGLTTEEVIAAARKYGARFVVSEKPKRFSLPMRYENSRFLLYAVPAGDHP